jgi:hypothetical protein
MAFYKKRIVRPDTPKDIAKRLAHKAACEQALAEMKERFPVLTVENFAAANAMLHQRIAELAK